MLLHYEAGQMAASDLRAIIPKLPLAFVGASTEEHLALISDHLLLGRAGSWACAGMRCLARRRRNGSMTSATHCLNIRTNLVT